MSSYVTQRESYNSQKESEGNQFAYMPKEFFFKVNELIDFARDICPIHRLEDLEELIDELDSIK